MIERGEPVSQWPYLYKVQFGDRRSTRKRPLWFLLDFGYAKRVLSWGAAGPHDGILPWLGDGPDAI